MIHHIWRLLSLSFLENILSPLVPLLARLIFTSTLFLFFYQSALTKLDGIFTPSLGAYAQIFPKQFEAAGYDSSAMGGFEYIIVLAGAYGELLLPLLIVVGLFTRIAAIGMSIFIVIMSYVDITAHGISNAGQLFDADPMGIIYDQRLLWGFVLFTLIAKGAGWLSLDQLFTRLFKNNNP